MKVIRIILKVLVISLCIGVAIVSAMYTFSTSGTTSETLVAILLWIASCYITIKIIK